MSDRLKQIPANTLERWNRLLFRQKAIIVSSAAGVILAMAILGAALTITRYEVLITCDTTKKAEEVSRLLEGDSITCIISEDGLRVQVLNNQLAEANLILGANNISAVSYDIGNVTEGEE